MGGKFCSEVLVLRKRSTMPSLKTFAGFATLAVVAGCTALPAARTFPPLPGDSGLEWVAITVKGLE